MSLDENITDEYLSPDWQVSYTFWVDGILTLVLVIVGLTGNVAMVISLIGTKKWIPLYYYFLAFALWNTALLASTVFFYCIPSLDKRIGESDGKFTYLNILGYPLANSGMTAAIWLVLGVTVERCIVVSRPLDQIVSEPKRRAKVVTALISVLAPLYNIPLFFELTVVKNGTDLAKSDMRDNPAYKIGYRIIGNMVFLSLIPFLSILCMSVRIIYVVQNAMVGSAQCRLVANGQKRSQATLSANSNAKVATKISLGSNLKITNKTSLMNDFDTQSPLRRSCAGGIQKNAYATHMTLALLATKFVLCYTLPTVLNILEIIVEPASLRMVGLGLVVDISNLMVVADSALNAFVYMSWRRKIQLQQKRSSRKASIRLSITQTNVTSSLRTPNGSFRNALTPSTSYRPIPSNGKIDEYAL